MPHKNVVGAMPVLRQGRFVYRGDNRDASKLRFMTDLAVETEATSTFRCIRFLFFGSLDRIDEHESA